jgi:class 3 adenylate cyclase/DNA-binding beta-propeller fold protein YncE
VAERPTGTVTFLFTDLEGSTELLRRLRDEYGGVLAMHQRLVRGAVERHRGVEVDTQGDAFFFAFQRASEAVQAAIETQRALAKQEWPDGVTVLVRMGLHTGEARLEDGRYHGLSVHRAARISSVAHGGQVLLSESTRALLADEEELSGVSFRDLGLLELKDFDRPIRVYRLSAPGLAEVDRRPRARPGRRRRVFLGVVVLAVVGSALAIALVTSLGGGQGVVHVPANSVAVIDPGTGRVRTAVSVGRAPISITLDPSAAWVANSGSDTITRIDDRTHATSTIGGFQSGLDQLAAGAGAVWATEMTAGLASVNVTTQTASPPVPLLSPAGVAYSAEGIAYGFGSLWVGGGLPSALVLLQIDPISERVVKSASVGVRSRHTIAVGQGGVWVSNLLADTVVEFDPKTLHVLRRISIGAPAAIAVGGGSLWVCGADDKAVWRLQEKNGYRSRTLIPVGGDPVAVAFGDGAAWAALADGTVAQIDAGTDAVRRTRIASALNAITVGTGAVWAEAGPVSFL